MGDLECHSDVLSMFRALSWAVGTARSLHRYFISALRLRAKLLSLEAHPFCAINPAAIILL